MAAPKGKFRDRIRVYSTKAGTRYVRVSDVLLNEDTKKDIRQLRDAFAKEERQSSNNTAKGSTASKSDR